MELQEENDWKKENEAEMSQIFAFFKFCVQAAATENEDVKV